MLNAALVLRTVQAHLPGYFRHANVGHVKPVREGEVAVDTGWNYIALRLDGGALVSTANMTWDGDNYGTIDGIPERMPLIS